MFDNSVESLKKRLTVALKQYSRKSELKQFNHEFSLTVAENTMQIYKYTDISNNEFPKYPIKRRITDIKINHKFVKLDIIR